MFSQFISRDIIQGFAFSLFINYGYTRECTCLGRQLKKKKTVLRGIPLAAVLHTWSEMGKQNLQATKVYYRCLYIEKEVMNMKYVDVAGNAILIFDT